MEQVLIESVNFLEPALTSHDERQLFRRARHARVEPARPMFAEGEGLIEKRHVVPLRTLGLVDGERITEIEFVRSPCEAHKECRFPRRTVAVRRPRAEI